MDIVIIGSGNVASHIAKAIDKVCHVAQIYSQTFDHAQILSKQLHSCQPIDDISLIDRDTDLYIIATSDDSITSIAHSLGKLNGIVVHTSGSVSIDALNGVSNNIGVFYPLQTFSKDVPLELSEVTFFTEASNDHTLATIDELAVKIGREALHASSEKRQRLHIAAVFACNFTNHLWSISESLLNEDGYDLHVLEPLIRTTLNKALTNGPHKSQTGPAARKDFRIIDNHVNQLAGDKQNIYRILSNSIINHLDNSQITKNQK